MNSNIKMYKKILSFVLAVVLVFSNMSYGSIGTYVAYAEGDDATYLDFILTDNGNVFGDNNWFKSNVVIKKEGYSFSCDEVSEEEERTYLEELVYSDEGNNTIDKLFVKKLSDESVLEFDNVSINIDKTNPVANIKLGESDLNLIEASDPSFGNSVEDFVEYDFGSTLDIEIKDLPENFGSGISTTLYSLVNEVTELDSISWGAYNSETEISLDNDTAYILYIKVVDNAGNEFVGRTDGFKVKNEADKLVPIVKVDPVLKGVYGTTAAELTITPGVVVIVTEEDDTETVVDGTWTFVDERTGDIPVVGTTNEYKLLFTPDDEQYDTVSVNIKPTISKATPNIGNVTVSSPSVIYTSTSYMDISLTRSDETISGTLALKEVSFVKGTNTCEYIFTPTDSSNYKKLTGEIIIDAVEDEIVSLLYEGELNKKQYIYGDEFDITGLTFYLEYESGKRIDVTSDITYGSLVAGQETVEISYVDTEASINVTCDVNGITVAKKKISVSGLDFDIDSNGYVYDGTEKEILYVGTIADEAKTKITVTGNKATNAGTYTAKVEVALKNSYKDNYELDGIIEVSKKWKIDKAIPDVGVVTYDDSNPIYPSTLSDSIILSRSDKTVAGTLKLKETTFSVGKNDCVYEFIPSDTDNYKKVTGTIEINVSADEVVELIKKGTLSKKSYVYGDTFSINGLSFYLKYKSGIEKNVTSDVTFGALKAGQTSIDVAYNKNSIKKICTVDGITVAKKKISISGLGFDINKDGYTYDGQQKVIEYTGIISDDTKTNIIVTGNKATNAGVYTAKVVVELKSTYVDNYELVGITEVSKEWKINKANPIIGKVTCVSGVFDTTSYNMVELARTNASVDGTLSLKNTTFSVGKGQYEYVFIPNDTNNYNKLEGVVEINVRKDKLESITYSGDLKKNSYVYEDIFKLDGISIKATYTSGITKNVTKEVVASDLKAGDTSVELSYTDDGITKSCTINGISVAKKKIIVNDVLFDVKNYVYDGTKKAVSLKGEISDKLKVSISGNEAVNAGTYNAEATITVKDSFKDNYEISGKSIITTSWTIKKAVPDLGTVTCAEKVYNTSDYSKIVLSRTNKSVKGNLSLVKTEFKVGNGVYTYKFIPEDSVNYTQVTGTITLNVIKDKLKNIASVGELKNKEFEYEDVFDIAGVKIIATYISGIEKDITSDVVFGKLKTGDTSIKVSYTEDGVTKSVIVDGFVVNKKRINIEEGSIGFNMEFYIYDGTKKSVEFYGEIPSKANVVITGNEATKVGTYEAKAILSIKDEYADNYELTGQTTVTAKWYIYKTLPKISLTDKKTTYTGSDISIDKAYISGVNQDDVPADKISYIYYLDKECTKPIDGIPQAVGTYYVVASLKAGDNYEEVSSNVAKLVIVKANPNIGKVTCGQTVFDTSLYNKVVLNRENTSVPGILVLDETTFPVGKATYTYKFIPNDTNNYKEISGKISINVVRDKLESIKPIGELDKKTYVYEDLFELSGVKIIAVYTSGIEKDVTDKSTYGSIKAGDTSILVSYVEGARKRTCTVNGFTVARKSIRVSGVNFSTATFTYDGTKKTVSFEGDLPEQVSYKLSGIEGINAGNYNARATLFIKKAYQNNYVLAGKTMIDSKWTISKATPTITISDKMVTYSGSEVSIGDPLISGVSANDVTTGKVSFRYYTDKACNNRIAGEPKNSGKYYVKAVVAADNNYTQATSNTAVLVVNKLTPMLGTIYYEGDVYNTTPVKRVKIYRTNESVPGTISLDNTQFIIGTNSYAYTFTPDDSKNYDIVKGKISINVKKDGLKDLRVEGKLVKTIYTYGDSLDLNGLTIYAQYDGGREVDVTNKVSIPSLKTGDVTATISYKVDGIEKTYEIKKIRVNKKKVDISNIKFAKSDFIYDGKQKILNLVGEIPMYVNVSVSGNKATDAGKYIAKATISLKQEFSNNYELSGKSEISFEWEIDKAKEPSVKPETIMNVGYNYKRVSDINLPTGWNWDKADLTKALTVGDTVNAVAIYKASNSNNYENISIQVSITRSECLHNRTELRGKKTESTEKDGYTGDTYCTVCGKKLSSGKVIPRIIREVSVLYTSHVQSYGWEGSYKKNGEVSGVTGQAKRLEAIMIKVEGNSKLGIQYSTHCQSYGWMTYSANGEMSGTTGEARRVEAIMINLTGADKDQYDVYYRVHSQSYGWLGWAKNGAPAGTAGLAKRMEAIQIVVLKKDTTLNVNMGGITSYGSAYIASNGALPNLNNSSLPSVEYKAHVQSYGWQNIVRDGAKSGTEGQAKRLEALTIDLKNKTYSGGIRYKAHVQNIGWQDWVESNQIIGTTGRALRMEALCIELTGDMAKYYDVYYRTHVQSYGWLDWAKNGEEAGTAGLSKRLESVQIILVPKGGNPPGNTAVKYICK